MNYVRTPSLGWMNTRLNKLDWQMHPECPACTSDRIKAFATIRHIDYWRCAECGLVFANPAPSDAATAAFYNSDFYNNYRALEQDTIARQPYFSISAYTDPHRLASWLDNCDRSTKVLDFGCGPGSFLALLRDRYGFLNVEGLELNAQSAEVAKRCYDLDLTPTIAQLRHERYDVIILFEVIEHLTRPAEIIDLCAKMLAPHGLLFITTPSVRNIPARWFPQFCSHYTGPSHVSLFTEAAIDRLLRRFGLKIEHLETDAAAVLGNAVVSPLYDLDFTSPASAADSRDQLYVPNRIGQRLGLKETRVVKSWPLRIARRTERVLNRLTRNRFSDHLYLLARAEH